MLVAVAVHTVAVQLQVLAVRAVAEGQTQPRRQTMHKMERMEKAVAVEHRDLELQALVAVEL
jgi:ribosome biogenesis protein Tsr3